MHHKLTRTALIQNDAAGSASSDSDPWLTLEQAASYVQVHPATLRREIRAGRLRHARVSGRKAIRFRRSWVGAWLETTSTPVEVSSR